LGKITSKEGDVGTSLAWVVERQNIPEEALEFAAQHALSLAYLFERHPNVASPPW